MTATDLDAPTDVATKYPEPPFLTTKQSTHVYLGSQDASYTSGVSGDAPTH